MNISGAILYLSFCYQGREGPEGPAGIKGAKGAPGYEGVPGFEGGKVRKPFKNPNFGFNSL